LNNKGFSGELEKNLHIPHIPHIIVDSNSNNAIIQESDILVCNSLQEAIDLVPVDNKEEVIIYIKKGIYKEKLFIDRPFITLIGEDVNNTKITYDVCNKTPLPFDKSRTYGTTGSASVTVISKGFIAKNITFENSFDPTNSNVNGGRQAVAIKIEGDKLLFMNCRFLGRQDTLYANSGRQYFVNCYIEGDVDFIFGGAQAVFEKCEIYSIDMHSTKDNGYITAPSTKMNERYGFLFIECKLKSNVKEKGTVALGRPWHPGGDKEAKPSAVFNNCYMDEHISIKGWEDMSGFYAKEARFFEFNSSGAGALKSETRRELNAWEAQQYTKEKVLGDWFIS
jgi:pectinesterase